jgi:two-component system, NtrC family, response regulator AtoC
MKTQSLNLFIVDDNMSAITALKEHLLKRFGEGIRILTFNNSKSCLENIDEYTNIVVLNNHLKGENGVDVLKSIKEVNPNTEVIVLSEEEDIASAVDSYKAGAKGLVIRGHGSRRRVAKLITRIFTAPIRIIERELDLSQRVAIFIMCFLTIGAIVVLYFIFYK